MTSTCPYNVTLGPDVMSSHANFAEALVGFEPYAHLNHAHIVNWASADVDCDGLTEEETEAIETARVAAKHLQRSLRRSSH